mgnify:CR=1 FL=1
MNLLHNILEIFTHFTTLISSQDIVDSANQIITQEPDKFNPLGGVKLVNWEDLIGLIIRLSVHLFFIFILVRLIYYPIAKRKDFLFTYFALQLDSARI